MKSKLLKIYWKKRGGQFFLNATKVSGERFYNKGPAHETGKALSRNVSDADLGKAVREVLLNCD